MVDEIRWPLIISSKKRPQTFEAPVLQLQVIDGDTLKLLLDTGFGGREQPHCRLLGVDAPEHTTNAGLLVADIVHRWCTARIASLEWESEKLDKYGRSLGDLTCGPESLANFLCIYGLAKEYSGDGRRSWSQDELDHVELIAKTALMKPTI